MSEYEFLPTRTDFDQAIGSTARSILKDAAESRWRRESHAGQIEETKTSITDHEAVIAEFESWSNEELKEQYEAWFAEKTEQIKKHNERAAKAHAHLTAQLEHITKLRDALEQGSPLLHVANAAIDDTVAARNVWERKATPTRTSPEEYRQKVIATQRAHIKTLQEYLRHYEEAHKRYTQGVTNMGLLNVLLDELLPRR